jgi:lipoprotein-anchoring transpeptidase ErfK/SrfK
MNYPKFVLRHPGVMVSSLCLLSIINFASTPSFGQMGRSNSATPVTVALADLKQSGRRWIEVKLANQRLIAWEGGIPVYAVIISTGKGTTPTPTGVFAIQTRQRTARMQGADYDVPDVPYTMYYYGGYAIHGAYWHNRFGTPVSHGCINVAVNHARWLFNWAAVGTPVVVHR